MTNLIGPAPAAPAPQPPQPSPPAPYFNTLAIVSLVSAFFVSLVAVITGHVALVQIRRTGERGHTAALVGVILGYLGIGFWLVVAVVVIVGSVIGAASGLHFPGLPGPAGTPRSFATVAPTAPPGSSSGSDSGSASGGDLSFDDGRDVLAAATPQISDGMLGDRDWALSIPKADGTWGYASKDGTCSVTFHQGDLDAAVAVDSTDDLATTNSYLGLITGEGADLVDQKGKNDSLALGQPDAGTFVETRGLSRTDADGKPHITVARAFAVPKKGVSIDVTCTTQDKTVDGYNHVLSRTGLIIS
ncbi:DUF4190 domain-containing protein [Subtercola boreus]|uniref:DUF4190 domain-containing protein n=1 Tax=Subtercola boreus TaxID=120213 RepID=UPI0015586CA7|nr:DUF4190 domain-containing protein [Subtercola boreus]